MSKNTGMKRRSSVCERGGNGKKPKWESRLTKNAPDNDKTSSSSESSGSECSSVSSASGSSLSSSDTKQRPSTSGSTQDVATEEVSESQKVSTCESCVQASALV